MAIGRTNVGGGGTGATLTVTAPANVTVTVSRDGKTYTKTANAEGLAVFKGLKTGVWTVTITDGAQTASRQVTVTADYEAAMTFFAATINVTYPAGSVCTCSDGVTTLTAPDTSGTWVCTVPNAGTWTICAGSAEEHVEITSNGQEKSVVYLYAAGNECTDITGGWLMKKWGHNSNYTKGPAPTLTKESACMILTQTTTSSNFTGSGAVHIANNFDISQFSEIRAHVEPFAVEGTKTSDDSVACGLSVINRDEAYLIGSVIKHEYIAPEYGTESDIALTVDVNSLAGLYDIAIYVRVYDVSGKASATITSVTCIK